MAVVYTFESAFIPSSEKVQGGRNKVQIMIQDSAPANWVAGLTEPDFTSSSIACLYTFTGIEITYKGTGEPGVIELDSVDYELNNQFLVSPDAVASGAIAEGMFYRVNGYTTVTYDSVAYATNAIFKGVAGEATYSTSGTGTVTKSLTMYDIIFRRDYTATTVHIRVSAWDGSAYKVRGAYIVDDLSLEIEQTGASYTDWIVSFTSLDSIHQLADRTLKDSLADAITHPALDYEGTAHYITWNGQSGWGGIVEWPGAHILTNFFYKDGPNGREDWVLAADSSDNLPLRFFNLVEFMSTMWQYLGPSTDVNDGGLWSGYYTSQFGYNPGESVGTGTNTRTFTDISSLYIISALWNLHASGTYHDYLTFFDESNTAPFSFKNGNSFLDILKMIAISLGATIRVRINTSGERFLEFAEIGLDAFIGSPLTITDQSTILTPVNLVPNTKAITGATVTAPAGKDEVRGQQDSNSKQLECYFGSLNDMRGEATAILKLKQDGTVGNYRKIITKKTDDFFSCLWISEDTATGSRSATAGTALTLASIYSLSSIMPRVSTAVSSGDPGNVPIYGTWASGVYYPSEAAPYNTWGQVVAMGLAHMYFNDVTITTDPVGYFRPFGEQHEVTLNYLLNARYSPPFTFIYTAYGETHTITVTEYTEDLHNLRTTFTGFTRDA